MIDKLEKRYSSRFVRILNNDDKSFFIQNYDVIPEIEKRLHDEISIPYDKTLKSILMSYNYFGETDFMNNIRDIIYSEIRNNKLNKILSENKVYNFSEFNKFFLIILSNPEFLLSRRTHLTFSQES